MINWSIFSLQRNTNKFVRKLVDASNNFRFTWTGLNRSALCLPWTNMCNMKTRQRSNSYMYTGVYYSKSNDPLSNYTNSWYIPQNAMHFLCRVVNVVLQIVYNEAQSIVRDRSFVLDQYISCDNIAIVTCCWMDINTLRCFFCCFHTLSDVFTFVIRTLHRLLFCNHCLINCFIYRVSVFPNIEVCSILE